MRTKVTSCGKLNFTASLRHLLLSLTTRIAPLLPRVHVFCCLIVSYEARAITLTPVKSSSEVPISDGGALDSAFPQDVGFAYRSVAINSSAPASVFDFHPPCLLKIEDIVDETTGSKSIIALYCTPTVPGHARHIGSNILIRGRDRKAPKGLFVYGKQIPIWLLHALGSVFLVSLVTCRGGVQVYWYRVCGVVPSSI